MGLEWKQLLVYNLNVCLNYGPISPHLIILLALFMICHIDEVAEVTVVCIIVNKTIYIYTYLSINMHVTYKF